MPSTSEPVVRPMGADDVDPAEVVFWSSIADVVGTYMGGTMPDRDAESVSRSRFRVSHLQRTDPGGAWVATDGDEVVGMALALRRGPLWFLSALAVATGRQSAAIGRRLLDAALTHADGAAASWILATPDPKALRRYASAGFHLHPCYTASGPLDRSLVPAGLGVREGDWDRDAALVEDVVTHLRGVPYGPDVEAFTALGARLRVVDGEGFAVLGKTRITSLGARTPDVAQRLLWDALAQGGDSAEVEWLSADQQWAIEVALAARLSLKPTLTSCRRGQLGPLTPYLPGGAYG